MGDLCKDIPKPLLTIKDVNLIEYKIAILPKEFTEVVLIIGHLGNKIREFFGDQHKGKKITYVETEPLGTGHSLWQAKKHLDDSNERFVVMCGDDLYSREDVKECLQHPYAALVFKTTQPQDGGKVVLNGLGFVEDIQEGKHPAGITIATGLYILDKNIFDLPLVQANNGKNEFGLPQTLLQMRNKIRAVYSKAWHQVTAPEDLNIPNEKLQKFL